MKAARLEYSGLRDLQGRFQRVSAEDREENARSIRQATEMVYQQARENIARMFKNSGPMQNALQIFYESYGAYQRGSVTIEGVGYVTQEFGGTKPYLIPRSPLPAGRALKFMTEGYEVFTPGPVVRGPLRERSFLRLALDQKRAEIEALFAGRVKARFEG